MKKLKQHIEKHRFVFSPDGIVNSSHPTKGSVRISGRGYLIGNQDRGTSKDITIPCFSVLAERFSDSPNCADETTSLFSHQGGP